MELEKQKLLISSLVSNRDLLAICISLIKPSYFDPMLKKGIKFIISYFEKYKDVPKLETIRAETGLILDSIGSVSKVEAQYISEEIEIFCRNKAIEEAILAGPELLQKGDYSKILETLKTAISVGLQKDIGLDYFNNPEERLRKTLEQRNTISTGWEEVDNLLGSGISRQELILFTANSGGGKSMTMLNLAKNLLFQGLNGIYISLEMAESVVSKRLDSMITKISQDQLLKELNKVAKLIDKASSKMGQFIIKRMPENRTNIHHIRSYLQQLEQAKGFKPDFIVIDYIDIMGTTHNISMENLFVKDKHVTEEVRSLGFDFNCIIISASQLGRCLDINTNINLSDGTVKKLIDIEIGDELLSNENNFVKVVAYTEPIKKRAFKISLDNSQYIIASNEHRFPIIDGGLKSIKSGLNVSDSLFVYDSNSITKFKKVQIKLIEQIDDLYMMDIQVTGNNLFFANGILTHNSALEADKLHQGHIQGGISKINTSDYTIGVKQDDIMRSTGEIYFECLKSRNSNGVGKRLLLKWDPISLCIESLNNSRSTLQINKKPKVLGITGSCFEEDADKEKKNGVLGLINL